MRITISGPPGSGKTTVGNMLSEVLGYKMVSMGLIFREYAASLGLSLADLGAKAEEDKSIDKRIDDRLLQTARDNEDLILESRLSAYMLHREGIPAFKVHITASPEVRMQRVGLRDGQNLEDAVRDTLERQASEIKRYKKYYDIDISDLSVYDLVIRTDDITPEQVTDLILNAVKEGQKVQRC